MGMIHAGERMKKARSCQGFKIQRLLWDLAFWADLLFMMLDDAKNTTECFQPDIARLERFALKEPAL
jgi:hypothetical protein